MIHFCFSALEEQKVEIHCLFDLTHLAGILYEDCTLMNDTAASSRDNNRSVSALSSSLFAHIRVKHLLFDEWEMNARRATQLMHFPAPAIVFVSSDKAFNILFENWKDNTTVLCVIIAFFVFARSDEK